jgi:hypothetical protein
LLELFTSQGCSSCPPADAVLAKYAMLNNQQIIPLAFHVDYWNRLGWTDSFSSSKFSQRQREYASFFNSESVYTPQVIINGNTAMVGSESVKINAAVEKALTETATAQVNIVQTTSSENKVNVKYQVQGNAANSRVYLALVQRKTVTHIRAGENKGVLLENYNVVRDLVSEDAAENNVLKLQLPRNCSLTDFIMVIFMQDKNSGNISAASQTELK